MEQILFRTQPLKNLRKITLKPFCGNSQNLLRPCDKFMSNFSKKTFGFRVLNNLAQHAEWPVFSLSKITPPYWATLCAKRTIEAATPVFTVCDGLPMSYTNHACIYDIWRVNVAPPMNTHNLPVCVLAMATNSISRSIVCPVLKILPET